LIGVLDEPFFVADQGAGTGGGRLGKRHEIFTLRSGEQ